MMDQTDKNIGTANNNNNMFNTKSTTQSSKTFIKCHEEKNICLIFELYCSKLKAEQFSKYSITVSLMMPALLLQNNIPLLPLLQKASQCIGNKLLNGEEHLQFLCHNQAKFEMKA